MKNIFVLILLMHGFLHLIGFLEAWFQFDIGGLSLPISKPMGLLWLYTAVVFMLTSVFFALGKEWWWIIGLAAVVVSQLLIIQYWQDVKYATLLNVVIFFVSTISPIWKKKETTRTDMDS